MSEYRVFYLDDYGRVFSKLDLMCASDDEAIGEAVKLESPNGIEVWKGVKRITKIKGQKILVD